MRRRLGRWPRAATFAAAIVLAVPACGPARVVPHGEAGVEGDRRMVVVDRPGLRIGATARPWSSPPARVLLRYTPLWVFVENTGGGPLRVALEDFALLLPDGRAVPADTPARVVATASGSLAETRVIRGEGLLPVSLAPGEGAKGYVFFRGRLDDLPDGEPVTLRLARRDAAAVEVPLLLRR